MKKIPCNYFGNGEYIYFNIARLAQLEQALGKKVTEFAFEVPGLTEMFHAFSIGLAHEKRRTPDWYANRIDELLEEGITFDDLSTVIVKALIGSGIMGKNAYALAFPDEVTEEDKAELKEESEKN